jgi:hypothetical protein
MESLRTHEAPLALRFTTTKNQAGNTPRMVTDVKAVIGIVSAVLQDYDMRSHDLI